MDLVILKANHSIKYSIFDFIKMTHHERQSLKRLICCPECKAIATYRKATVDGKVACFYATHIDGCDIGNTNKGNKNPDTDDVESILIDESNFGIRWNYSSENSKGISTGSGTPSNSSSNGKGSSYTGDPSTKKVANLTLPKLLNYAEHDKINDIDISITINKTTKNLSDIVNKIDTINDNSIDEVGFYWGEMKFYSDNFINLRSNNTSIVIPERIKEEFDSRYKSKFFDVVNNNLMIIHGKVKKNKNGGFYITINDCNKIYFRKKSN